MRTRKDGKLSFPKFVYLHWAVHFLWMSQIFSPCVAWTVSLPSHRSKTTNRSIFYDVEILFANSRIPFTALITTSVEIWISFLFFNFLFHFHYISWNISIYTYLKKYCSGEGLEGNIRTIRASPPKSYNRHLNKEKEKKTLNCNSM